jgi:hypothetical protein
LKNRNEPDAKVNQIRGGAVGNSVFILSKGMAGGGILSEKIGTERVECREGSN